ncbi:MAG: carboxypeptidase regulatory-like domain-containing protein [Pseudomonadota bacterium]
MQTSVNRIGLVAVLLLLVSTGITAAELRVRVFERGGNLPLAGVAVCLGTSAKLDQFGATRTDAGGYAVFDSVPRASLLVTASMSGYKTEQESLVTSNTSRMLVLSLSSGGGGASCITQDEGTGESAASLRVGRFAINGGAAVTTGRGVTLDAKVIGAPTQYRASEQADFGDAQWQDINASAGFTLSQGAGKKTVYYQVRRHSTLDGAVLEILSPTVSDSILLQGQ